MLNYIMGVYLQYWGFVYDVLQNVNLHKAKTPIILTS